MVLVLFQAKLAHTTLPPERTFTFLHDLHSLGSITNSHYRRWLNNYDANFVHIPGTHFAAGLMGDLFLPMPKAGLE